MALLIAPISHKKVASDSKLREYLLYPAAVMEKQHKVFSSKRIRNERRR